MDKGPVAPFGDAGRSGTGTYHGKAGFDVFRHYRTVVGTVFPFTIAGRTAPQVQRLDAGGFTLRTADAAQPHPPSAQVLPLIACSRAQR